MNSTHVRARLVWTATIGTFAVNLALLFGPSLLGAIAQPPAAEAAGPDGEAPAEGRALPSEGQEVREQAVPAGGGATPEAAPPTGVSGSGNPIGPSITFGAREAALRSTTPHGGGPSPASADGPLGSRARARRAADGG